MTWTPDLLPRSQFESKASGYIFLGTQEVAHTVQCCHCAAHFVSVRGSGHVRGHCVKCNATTCGARACDPCVPKEKRLEIAEAAERGLILPGQY